MSNAQIEPGPDEFRRVLGSFATGVTIVTTVDAGGTPYGMTASAFCSVSLEPPLVLVCLKKGGGGSASLRSNGVFAVNILAADQEALARRFASSQRPRGREGFASFEHRAGSTKSPLLAGAVAHIDCTVYTSHDAGDHDIFLGRVVALDVDPARPALLFHHGTYRTLDA